MKRVIGAGLVALLLMALWAIPVAAAPDENASHVAHCATGMGGQHVATCAQTMEQGVSTCARM